ncbi:MAG: septation protein A [Alphaproteobacteria bacterium]|nr:septation protein A [Alphaproteobacteria bacterium]
MSGKLNPGVKLILDFAPLAVFFAAFKLGDVLSATLALMVATAFSIAVIYAVERKLALAPLISGGLVMVLGGLSVAFHNEQFIKMKPTVVNLVFAAILLGGVLIYKRGLLKYVLDMAFTLTDEGWRVLSRRWGFFFLFLAALNETIWRNFSTEFWVNFKVFGMFTLTIAFAISQFRVVERYKP